MLLNKTNIKLKNFIFSKELCIKRPFSHQATDKFSILVFLAIKYKNTYNLSLIFCSFKILRFKKKTTNKKYNI